MLKKAGLLAVVGAVLASPVSAQDLDEILTNYYEAVGGLDAWKAVKSIRRSGTMMMGGMGIEAPFTITVARPDKVRLEFSLQGMTGVQAFDGETAWMLMPFMGSTDPEEMPEDMSKDVVEMADLDGPLIGYEDEGHQLEYVGMEETEGTQAYKLKVTLNTGDVQYYFLDSEYFIPIRVETTREVQGRTMVIEANISDYKEVGGLMIPHSIANKPQGAAAGQVITFELVELNVDVADSDFAMPKTEGEGQQ